MYHVEWLTYSESESTLTSASHGSGTLIPLIDDANPDFEVELRNSSKMHHQKQARSQLLIIASFSYATRIQLWTYVNFNYKHKDVKIGQHLKRLKACNNFKQIVQNYPAIQVSLCQCSLQHKQCISKKNQPLYKCF